MYNIDQLKKQIKDAAIWIAELAIKEAVKEAIKWVINILSNC